MSFAGGNTVPFAPTLANAGVGDGNRSGSTSSHDTEVLNHSHQLNSPAATSRPPLKQFSGEAPSQSPGSENSAHWAVYGHTPHDSSRRGETQQEDGGGGDGDGGDGGGAGAGGDGGDGGGGDGDGGTGGGAGGGDGGAGGGGDGKGHQV